MNSLWQAMRPWRNLGIVVVLAIAGTLLYATFTHATAPPYSLTTDNPSYSVTAGGSQDIGVTLNNAGTPLDTPVDICLLNSSGTGTGLPAATAWNQISLQNDGDTGTISVLTDAGTTPGDYTLTVGQCDGSVLSAPFTFTVNAAPDYSLSADSSATALPSSSVPVNVSLTPSNGFAGSVNVCLFSGGGDPAPAGISLEGSPVAFSSGSYSQQLTIDVSAAVAPDSYDLVFGACDQSHYASDTNLTVNQAFAVAADDSDLTTYPGHALDTGVTVTNDPAFSGTVALAASGMPTGITVDAITSASSFPADQPITVHVAGNTAPGDYPITITGSSSGQPDSSDSFTVHVVSPAPDGDGALSLDQTNAAISSSGNTLNFHYTAGNNGGLDGGAVTVQLPAGWTAPSTDSSNGGYVTSSDGSVSVSGQTFTISGLNLADGETVDMTYGDQSGGGPGATAPSSNGVQAISAKEKSTSGGTAAPIDVTAVSLEVTAAAGSGTLTVSPKTVALNACNLTHTFTYTAATGGIDNGELIISVPDGWTSPSTDNTVDGFTSASGGGNNVIVGAEGSDIMVAGIVLAAGQTMTITYGDTAGGSNNGVCGPADGGDYVFAAYEASAPAQDTQGLDTSPDVVAASPDGTGDLALTPGHAGLSSTGNSLDFVLTNVAMGGGELDIAVPTGWSAPSLTNTDAGAVSASCQPECSIALGGTNNRTIQVSGITMGTSDEVDITYGDQSNGGPGATAPSSGTTNSFAATAKSTAGGTLTTLADGSPSITLVSSDGSGTMTVAPAVVPAGISDSSLPTETFTYTAAAGGLDNGSVQLVVPDDWDAPQTDDPNASAYVAASCSGCQVNLDGQTIEVDGITLAGGSTFTITYANGDTPPSGGDETWWASEQSSQDGSMTELATSPDISAVAADGSGDVTVTPSVAVTGVSHNSLDFNYTAADGGLTGGVITVKVPTGWSPPSTKTTDPGYTTCNTDGCSVAVNASTMTITVSGITIDGGESIDIVYGDQSHGSSGAKSGAAGNAVFTLSEKSWTGGTLTALDATNTTVTVLGPPKITKFMDTSIGDGTGQLGLWEDPVEIDGSNFQSVTDVQFNGTSVDAFDVSDDGTSIQTAIPDGATTGKITLVYPGGKVATATNFTVIVPPQITSFTPDGGIAPGLNNKPAGTTVTIKGTGFTGADAASGGTVDFGGTFATTWKVVSDTQITAVVPSGATTGPINVTNAADTGSSDQDFVVLQPPSITGFDPQIGGPGMQIEIDGQGFDYGGVDPKLRPVVKFNGKVSTNVQVSNDGVILATVPTGATTGPITVTNQAASATTAQLDTPNFTVVNPPKVASFKPVMGLADDGSGTVGTTVTLTGTGFTGATDVFFAGSDTPIDVTSDSFTVSGKGGTTITVQVPQNAVTGQIAVENAGGTSYSKGNFAVIVPPSIDSFSPTSGKIGGQVTLYGSGFTGTTGVLFTSSGGTVAAAKGKWSVKNDGQVNATIPAGAGTGPITIVNPAATDGVASDDDFNVVAAPTVTGFVVADQPAVVGESVEIDGSNFTFATKVTFGGVAQYDFTVGDDNTINTTVPPGAKTGVIAVTAPAGVGTGKTTFKVVPPPTITSINPTQAGVGTNITITGTNFGPKTNTADNISEVDIGDATDASVVSATPTKLVVTVPDDATTGYVVVYTNDRGYAVSPKQFGVLIAPSIDSVSSDSGVIGAAIQIYGSGFTGVSKVTFNGTVAKFKIANDGEIDTSVPKGATSGVIEITNPVDVADSDTFSVIVAPKFTSFSPTTGANCDSLTINGSGFTGVTQITWDADTLTLDNADYEIASDSEIDLTIPSADQVSSGKKLTITNAAGSVTTTAYTITGNDC